MINECPECGLSSVYLAIWGLPNMSNCWLRNSTSVTFNSQHTLIELSWDLCFYCVSVFVWWEKAPQNPGINFSPACAPSGQLKPVARWGSEHTGLCTPLWFPAPAQELWLPYASHVATSGPATTSEIPLVKLYLAPLWIIQKLIKDLH